MDRSERKFIVKVNARNSFMYWTWSGATVCIDDAAIFTESTVPDLFRPSLNQPYVERIYLE